MTARFGVNRIFSFALSNWRYCDECQLNSDFCDNANATGAGMAKPTNFDYAFYKKNKPKDLVDDPKTQVNMTFLHNHYIDYPKLDKHSKVDKVMYNRVNAIRQMTICLKKTRDSINLAYKN